MWECGVRVRCVEENEGVQGLWSRNMDNGGG